MSSIALYTRSSPAKSQPDSVKRRVIWRRSGRRIANSRQLTQEHALSRILAFAIRHSPLARALRRLRFPEQLMKDGKYVGGFGDAFGSEIRPRLGDGPVSPPQFGTGLVAGEDFHFALVQNLDISVLLAERHDVGVQHFHTVPRIAGLGVAVGRLRGVDVPVRGRVAFLL